MQLRFSVDPRVASPGTPSVDAVIDADESLTVRELGAALRADPAELFPGIDPDLEFSATGVLMGCTLGEHPTQVLPAGTLRWECVGGPYAGESVGLPGGASILLGFAAGSQLRVLDPALEDRHLLIEVPPADPAQPAAAVLPASVRIAPATPGAEIWVNGVLRDEPTMLGPEDVLQVGESIFRIGRQPLPNANIMPESPGRVAFNRASRILPVPGARTVKLPGERPDTDRANPVPWLSALIPVIIGITAALVFGRMMMLLFAVASPLMVIGTYFTSKTANKRNGKRTTEKWRAEIIQARADLNTIAETQRVQAWQARLDPVQTADFARTPTSRLWERRLDDPDALSIRIGVAEEELRVSFEGHRVRRAGEAVTLAVSPTPFCVDLAEGVTGIAGPRPVTLSVARSMIIALAVCRTPRDLSLVLFCADEAAAEWSWFRWLPHADTGINSMTRIGNTEDTRRARLKELNALLESRRASSGSRPASPDSHLVVILDNARSYRTLPGMVNLLAQGPAHGIHIIALENDRSKLPEESSTEIRINPEIVTRAEVLAADGHTPTVLLDGTTVTQAEATARALAPIVHVGGAGDNVLLPGSVRFVELLGLDLDDPSPLLARWAFNPRDTRAIIGAGTDGPFAVDLAADGPHGLVAGTTGAGKSEFLQTLVTSLALANRPDALNFVLVDYKGGSAFADCEWLPHTVGLVTNLDGRETERALESLDAELKRRETVLKDLGAKDANAAWEKNPARASAENLARLVLVIDEFAELKTELPDFVDGLVRIARVGRSLGVHLILATQRPSGAITPEMQSNTNLRVALRVTDKADSSDILGSPEASAIKPSTPGRGYVRRGIGAQPAAFQTARVAGRRPGVIQTTTTPVRTITRTWNSEGIPAIFPEPATPHPSAAIDHDDTDLRALVNLIATAAEKTGIPKNPSPWLDPLPPLLTLDSLPAPDSPTAILLGLEDVPSEQAQRPLTWDPTRDSHLALVGGARSGKTTTMRVIISQLVEKMSPQELHLYVIDLGSGALLPAACVPHCGAAISSSEIPRLRSLLERLQQEIDQRQGVFADRMLGSIQEQRASARPGEALPYLIVALEGWDRLVSDFGQDEAYAFREDFRKILREGSGVGIRVLMSGDRGLAIDNIKSFIPDSYFLPLVNPADYDQIGIKAKDLPAEIPPGRAYRGGPTREYQFATLNAAPDGAAQASEYIHILERATHTHRAALPKDWAKPFRLDPVPSFILLSQAQDLPRDEATASTGIICAVGGNTLSRLMYSPQNQPGFVITGSSRSGRSSTLVTFAAQLNERPGGLLIMALPRSPLHEYAHGHNNLLISDPDTDPVAVQELADRAIAAASKAGLSRAVLLVDDINEFRSSPVEDTLTDRFPQLSIIAAAHEADSGFSMSGLLAEAKKGRIGVFLSPTGTSIGSTVFNATIPKEHIGQHPPGRAAILLGGRYDSVQIPIYDPLKRG
ncbi:FtsK/SpoIIIE domain-containing protein [Mycetocola spongiae]|uniref:FtsK/SpoIIIE domain-containing protein n=1 Tax=Mycetocola spongiae TaxID=2859226 RepID=UPI001CF3411D|nr:FtsK/SpoIIIE domain-containing protein [Mycetocola spongiae]UCR89978.1 hypothetical protein KXZ72_04755 [Mycetocola spongiae]